MTNQSNPLFYYEKFLCVPYSSISEESKRLAPFFPGTQVQPSLHPWGQGSPTCLAHVNTTSPSFPSSSPFPSIHSINRRSPHSVFSFSFQSQHSRHFALIEIVRSHFISCRSFLSYSGQSKVHFPFFFPILSNLRFIYHRSVPPVGAKYPSNQGNHSHQMVAHPHPTLRRVHGRTLVSPSENLLPSGGNEVHRR